MSEKKRFLLRLDSEVYDALERWAAGELRSVNSQIEYLLREALVKARRLGPSTGPAADDPGDRPAAGSEAERE